MGGERDEGVAPTSSEDYAKIESVMQSYASDYRQSGYTDTFYSTEQHGFANSEEYDNWKNSMLKSVYENGGFYIGRYEVGTDTERNANSDILETPLIQRDKYPYNYVTYSRAQNLAKQLSTAEKTSSLMFGIQWDLIMKYIEEKGGKTQEELKTDSSSWGNYKNATFEVNRGEYSEYGQLLIWSAVGNDYIKPDYPVLLKTGETDKNSILGIYDLAGNLWEWTLETNNYSQHHCTDRSGGDYFNGFDYPACSRGNDNTTLTSYAYIGVRPALW